MGKKELQEMKSKHGNKFELLIEGEKRRVKDILELQNKHKKDLKSKDDEIENLKTCHKSELTQKNLEIANLSTNHSLEMDGMTQEYEETINEVIEDNKKLKL